MEYSFSPRRTRRATALAMTALSLHTSNMADSSMGGLNIFMILWDCIMCERHQSVVLNWQPGHENTAPAKAYESVETWSGTSRYLENLLFMLIIISNAGKHPGDSLTSTPWTV